MTELPERIASPACVFCRIVAGRAPCSRVHEDDVSLGFMGIRPARPGELMIIPKAHIDHFCDIPDELAAHILLVAQALSRAIHRTLNPPRVGLIVHGFGVPHAHLIVIPQHEDTDITSGRFAYLDEGRIEFSNHHLRQVPRHELDDVAVSLAARPLSWVRRERERGGAE